MKIGDDAEAWVDEEFETLDLRDPRRDRRAKELAKWFASPPTAGIAGECEGWTETMAAYRFLGNERIDWRDIMQPHWDRTMARMGQLPVVLCIADTTELNFNGQDIEGAGPAAKSGSSRPRWHMGKRIPHRDRRYSQETVKWIVHCEDKEHRTPDGAGSDQKRGHHGRILRRIESEASENHRDP